MYGNNIINIIDEYVQNWARENFKNDECPPKYLISLCNSNINNQHIIVTITHLGRSFSENIFPRNNTEYGYNSLDDLLMNLYNITM